MKLHKAVLGHLSTRVLNVPLLIAPAKLEVILSVIGSRIGLEAQEIEVPVLESRVSKKKVSIENPEIDIISVHGTLVHRTQGLDTLSGLRSYLSIRKDFQQALENPVSSAILFDFGSNGGEVAGMHDLADAIYEARGTKPIYAFVNEAAYSAAYGLASAADEIIIPRTGGVGSIGVVAVHVDQSGADEKEGLIYTPIYAGQHKIDFSSHQPLSDQAREVVQREVNQVDDLFKKTIARNRKTRVSLQEVRDMEAAIYMGKNAVKVGLADHVMSWDATIKYIISQIKKGGVPMNSAQAIEQIKTVLNEDGVEMEEVMSSLNYVPRADIENVETLAQSASDDYAASVEAMSQRTNEIVDICMLAGTPDMIREFLAGDMSIENVRKKVMDAKADASQEIISTVGAISTGEVNPLIANAEKRAGKAKKEAA